MKSGTVVILCFLLVIERCGGDISERGYVYPQPVPPVQFDEPTDVYLPPVIQDFPPPLDDTPQFINPPDNSYLPPVLYPPLDNPPLQDELPPSPPSLYQAPPPTMKILNMSCTLDTSFKTLVKIDSKTGVQPVMDGKDGCITRTSSPAVYAIEIEDVRRMNECGVRRCVLGVTNKANMCATLRLPTIKGIRLPEDVTMTLQCAPRDSIVSHTKHIRLGPTTITKGRSTKSSIVASGGGQYNFDSQIFLLRKSPGSNNFDQLLQTGSVVQLGEEMLLRTKIQDGDEFYSTCTLCNIWNMCSIHYLSTK
ncbi:unnamed protein product [Acanthoscelides obtectus]|uniref:Uncharacterized protein n=1 Tax=Acanthoscelides obtectus TaxID=200917 RepID=A0A9P0M4M8_ACAOB|nr:unnamed protein product [Acanthoscelides obtectus]CAK1667105.1 hypothetical protein AOBTE_LOCUS25684 [Acanthoscelides obtectus]